MYYLLNMQMYDYFEKSKKKTGKKVLRMMKLSEISPFGKQNFKGSTTLIIH